MSERVNSETKGEMIREGRMVVSQSVDELASNDDSEWVQPCFGS